jgi:hypothetical protein
MRGFDAIADARFKRLIKSLDPKPQTPNPECCKQGDEFGLKAWESSGWIHEDDPYG